MPHKPDRLRTVAALGAALEAADYNPVLVGGMALVIFGSQRVTNDFDILVSRRDGTPDTLVGSLYGHSFEMVKTSTPTGEVVSTFKSNQSATSHLYNSRPTRIPFVHRDADLQVDLWLDYPFPAGEITSRAIKVTVSGGRILVAAPEDLLQMKKLAFANRKTGQDAQDIEFLRRHERKK